MTNAFRVRHFLGFFRQRPGAAAVTVLTLGLGIGANTAMFSALDALILKPLPYADSDRLVVPQMIKRDTAFRWRSVSYPDVLDWQKETELFEQVALYIPADRDLTDVEEPVRLPSFLVSEGYFPLIRARPVIGRGFLPGDYAADAESVAVLSVALWQRLFGGRPEIIGSALRLNDEPHTVVGVVDARSLFPTTADLWLPLKLGDPVPDNFLRRDNYFGGALLRLQTDTALETAQARVAMLARRVAQELPTKRGNVEITLVTLKEAALGPEPRRLLGLVFATVFLVLVVACFNAANLLLIRSVERRREMAVRLALGASRGHLLRLLAGESVVLSVLSGALGVAVARLAITALSDFAPTELPGMQQLSLNAPAVAFAVALSCAIAFAFGLLPAAQLTHSRLGDGLRERGPESAAGGRRGRRLRNGLMVAQLAVCLVVLVTTGLMIRSLGQLARRDLGLEMTDRLTVNLDLPRARYPSRAERNVFFQDLLERLRAHPEVRRAGAASSLPLGSGGDTVRRSHLIEHQQEPPEGREYGAMWNVVDQEYFPSMGIPLIRGRLFGQADRANTTLVAIINRTLAEEMFPGQDPIGRRIRSWRDENQLREIVGVVGGVRYHGSSGDWQPMVYVPHTQVEWPRLTRVVLQAAGGGHDLAAMIRDVVWDLDDKLPLEEIISMEAIAAGSVNRERRVAGLLGVFSVAALILAALGLYGVVSYSMSQRRVEMGIRMALGAGRGAVVLLVLRQGLVLGLGGCGLGLLAAFPVSRTLEALLTDVSPADPLTYSAVALLLLAVVVLSSLGPATRAARVEPLEALRSE